MERVCIDSVNRVEGWKTIDRLINYGELWEYNQVI